MSALQAVSDQIQEQRNKSNGDAELYSELDAAVKKVMAGGKWGDVIVTDSALLSSLALAVEDYREHPVQDFAEAEEIAEAKLDYLTEA